VSKMKEKLNNLFEYRDGELIRKVSGRGRSSKVGDSAGTRRPDGRVQVKVDGKDYLRYRLIWIMLNGEIPEGLDVDHIDNDAPKSDDRIENLRLATRTQNLHNIEAKGCCWTRGKWRAQIQHQGKTTFLGYFKCETAAHFAYLKAKKKYAKEFAPHVA